MANKEYFTQLEILQDMKEVITGDEMVYYDDLLYEAFDTGCYIIGRREAEKALEKYGVFKAMGKVRDYELESFGEIYTDLTDPEEVADRLYYVLGEDTLQYNHPELTEAYYTVLDRDVTEENNQILLDVIDRLIDEVK